LSVPKRLRLRHRRICPPTTRPGSGSSQFRMSVPTATRRTVRHEAACGRRDRNGQRQLWVGSTSWVQQKADADIHAIGQAWTGVVNGTCGSFHQDTAVTRRRSRRTAGSGGRGRSPAARHRLHPVWCSHPAARAGRHQIARFFGRPVSASQHDVCLAAMYKVEVVASATSGRQTRQVMQ
jgi:hypothetical protein